MGLKKLTAVRAELESHMAKADYLDDAFKVSWKEGAEIKVVVEKQRVRLDTAGARMVVLRHHRNEASALTASCCKKQPQVEKIWRRLSKRRRVFRRVLLLGLVSGTVWRLHTRSGT